MQRPANKIKARNSEGKPHEVTYQLLNFLRGLERITEDDTKFVFQQLIEHIESGGSVFVDDAQLRRIIGM